jgi:hypothetical protein
MALTLFKFHNGPHDFAVTKINSSIEEFSFILDFARPLERIRWLGVTNQWLGITVGLLVPVVHLGQDKGEFVISVHRGQPYFADIPKLWRVHYNSTRAIKVENIDGLEVVADFGRHFPTDCQ